MNLLKKIDKRLKENKKNTPPDNQLFLYWLGYRRALEWVKTQIKEAKNEKRTD